MVKNIFENQKILLTFLYPSNSDLERANIDHTVNLVELSGIQSASGPLSTCTGGVQCALRVHIGCLVLRAQKYIY